MGEAIAFQPPELDRSAAEKFEAEVAVLVGDELADTGLFDDDAPALATYQLEAVLVETGIWPPSEQRTPVHNKNCKRLLSTVDDRYQTLSLDERSLLNERFIGRQPQRIFNVLKRLSENARHNEVARRAAVIRTQRYVELLADVLQERIEQQTSSPKN